jgi:hypothetical protein
MAQFSESEILNEASKVFRGQLETSKVGGSLNIQEEYLQLLEMASTTFLIYPDAIFYLAQLASNTLRFLVKTEVALLEDMLSAMESFALVGTPVKNTALLNDINTALLSLDAADSPQGRPEASRVVKLLKTYAGQLKENTVKNKSYYKTRELGRIALVEDLKNLKTNHAKLLSSTTFLKDLLVTYKSLNISGKVSANTLSRIRASISDLLVKTETYDDSSNIAMSWKALLTALTGVASIKTISTSSSPGDVKYSGSTLGGYYGRATGAGSAAFVTTGPGPWYTPMSGPLVLSVDGGATQHLHLEELVGLTTPSRNQEPFVITADKRNLHAILDPQVYEGTVVSSTHSSYGDEILIDSFINLRIVHIGALVHFPESTGTDRYTRALVAHRLLQNIGTITSFNPDNGYLIATGFSAGDESGTGFHSYHAGCLIHDFAGNPFAIEKVVSSSTVIVSTNVSAPPVVGSGAKLRGQSSALGTTKFYVKSILGTLPTAGQKVSIGPVIKTISLDIGSWTALQLSEQLKTAPGPGEFETWNTGSSLSNIVTMDVSYEDSSRVAVSSLTRIDPYISITDTFISPQNGLPAKMVGNSARDVIGYLYGEVQPSPIDANNVLTALEMSNLINKYITGVKAEPYEDVIVSGNSMSVTPGSYVVQDLSRDFSDVLSGDLLTITSGDLSGTYHVASVSLHSLTISNEFEVAKQGLSYKVVRTYVKIASLNSGLGSSIEILESPAVMRLDHVVHYGDMPEFESINSKGEQLDLSKTAVGDILKIAGNTTKYSVTAVNGTTLSVSPLLTSNQRKVSFDIHSGGGESFKVLSSNLETFLTSANFLKKYSFDVSLDELDAAISSTSIRGQNLAVTRSSAQRLIAHLLSILSTSYLRTGEYSTVIPTAAGTLDSVLSGYRADKVEAVDYLLESFIDRKYDRATDLLITGDLSSFFDTNYETGSYSGYLMLAARDANSDLPESVTANVDSLRSVNVASNIVEVPDAEYNFSDSAEEPSYDL